MEDREIVAALSRREEAGLAALQEKYGAYCHATALRILGSPEDAEEAVNDALAAAWRAIPPHKPERLSAFLAKLTRNAALNRLRRDGAQRRGGGAAAAVYEELSECIPGTESVADAADARELERIVGNFVYGLPQTKRKIFLCRYWYFEPVSEIAARFGFSEAKVTSVLFRLRKKLLEELKKEGYAHEYK